MYIMSQMFDFETNRLTLLNSCQLNPFQANVGNLAMFKLKRLLLKLGLNSCRIERVSPSIAITNIRYNSAKDKKTSIYGRLIAIIYFTNKKTANVNLVCRSNKSTRELRFQYIFQKLRQINVLHRRAPHIFTLLHHALIYSHICPCLHHLVKIGQDCEI